jgi:hypothetical protein
MQPVGPPAAANVVSLLNRVGAHFVPLWPAVHILDEADEASQVQNAGSASEAMKANSASQATDSSVKKRRVADKSAAPQARDYGKERENGKFRTSALVALHARCKDTWPAKGCLAEEAWAKLKQEEQRHWDGSQSFFHSIARTTYFMIDGVFKDLWNQRLIHLKPP